MGIAFCKHGNADIRITNLIKKTFGHYEATPIRTQAQALHFTRHLFASFCFISIKCRVLFFVRRNEPNESM
jgi:hypothetical protein